MNRGRGRFKLFGANSLLSCAPRYLRMRPSDASPECEFAYRARKHLQRSLKEAAGELEARLAANRERRFPVMGLRGASNALMLREMALKLARPLVVITSLQAE